MDLRARDALVVLIAALFACTSSSTASKDDDESDDFEGSCELVAKRCHSIDTKLGKECHELAHDGDDEKCGPREEECLEECPKTDDESDDDTHGEGDDDAHGDDDGGTADAADEVALACAAFCTCMTATCESTPDYPFESDAQCRAACTGFTLKDRTCYAKSCEKAKTAADKAHECAHATGAEACH